MEGKYITIPIIDTKFSYLMIEDIAVWKFGQIINKLFIDV